MAAPLPPGQRRTLPAGRRLGVDHLVDHLAGTGGRSHTGITPREAAERVAGVDLDRPLGHGPEALAELSRLWLDDAIWFHEPTAAAHLNCPVVIPALTAEVFISGVNSSLDTFDQSAGAHLHRAPPGRLDGRPHRLRRRPPTASSRPAAPSPTSRPCCWLAASTSRPPTGCGSSPAPTVTSRCRRPPGCSASATRRSSRVPVDVSRRMDPAALSSALADAVARGDVPMAVVATAGTTDFGAIDPLPEVAGARPGPRRVAPRRRGLRRRAAGLAPPPRLARRHRARRLGGHRLPQDLVPAGLVQRARRPRRGHARARHLARRLPQPEGLGPPQPGRQEPPDHAPLRGAQALDDACG